MKKAIGIVLLMMMGLSAQSQVGLHWEHVRQSTEVSPYKELLQSVFFVPTFTNLSNQQTARQYPLLHSLSSPNNSSPKWYSTKELAFFCRIEVELEKSVKMPVKFRLGNVPYVDYLEGKRRSY